MLRLRLIISSVILIGMSAISLAAERVALVVGNSEYTHAPSLTNPKNDAADISAAFERLGFEVTTVNDLGFDAMRRALRAFNDKASQAEMAVIFYAGHGMEVNKQNYLVPADAKLKTDRDISFEAIPLGLVTEAVSGARTLRLVILDACRDNPFATSMKMTSANRSLGRGLARIEPAAGTLVSYAAKERNRRARWIRTQQPLHKGPASAFGNPKTGNQLSVPRGARCGYEEHKSPTAALYLRLAGKQAHIPQQLRHR